MFGRGRAAAREQELIREVEDVKKVLHRHLTGRADALSADAERICTALAASDLNLIRCGSVDGVDDVYNLSYFNGVTHAVRKDVYDLVVHAYIAGLKLGSGLEIGGD